MLVPKFDSCRHNLETRSSEHYEDGVTMHIYLIMELHTIVRRHKLNFLRAIRE